METTKILESLESYFQNVTDYAVLISGEWGAGKTYFLKEEVFPEIKKKGLRTIYISLIGLNDEIQLENRIFQQINPFHFSRKKSPVSIEADHIESIINNSEKPKVNIPENIVLCFDDFERINPSFFESAMGIINFFIEHHKTKCIILCNEQIIEKDTRFTNYKSVKEKYIRFTFSFNTNFANVIEGRIKKLEIENLGFDQVPVIIDVFKKGNSSNIRILFFVLSIYKQVVDEVNKFSTDIQQKKQILKLILTYCGFYTIESKRGTSFEVLDKISISINRNDWSFLGNNEEDFSGDFSTMLEGKVQEEPNDDFSEEIEKIQIRYFNDASFHFERFVSVAELIKSGYLDTDLLKNEIITLNEVLSNSELIQKNKRILEILDNVFELADSEVKRKIEYIVEEVEKGKFDLQTYLKLYIDLVWLESFNIDGIEVSKETTEKFKKGVKKAFESGKLKYVQNLLFQIRWNKNDKSESAIKFNSFAAFVDSLNKRISEKSYISNFEKLKNGIVNKNYEELSAQLNQESDLKLTKENANQIFEVLKKTNASTSNHFYRAIMERYVDTGSTISHMPKMEKDFILSLYGVLEKNEDLDIETKKPLSKVPLIYLKEYLGELIKKRSLK